MTSLIDGNISFKGQNAGITPDKVSKNQVHKAINASFKNDSLNSRSAFIHVPITVTTSGTELGLSYQEIFDKGKFQGERVFNIDQQSYIVSVRGGLIFKADLKRGCASVLRTATNDRIGRGERRVHISQAGRFMVIHDFPNVPVIIDDGKAVRSNYYAIDSKGLPSPEIPQSRLSVYLQNRLIIANHNEFTAGDPVGNSVTPRAPITFIEVLTSNAPFVGQTFSLGQGFGQSQISAMGYISSRNSQSRVQSTKYGPLYVATRKSLHIYDAELARADWQNSTFGRLELDGIGIVGQRAHTLIGSDVMFQDIHGNIHSLTKNQNDARSGWSNTIISREVENWLECVNLDFLDIGIITQHNKRVYIGAKPARKKISVYHGQTEYDYFHQGMVVMELNNTGTIEAEASPIWAGLWTGINPMEITSVDNEVYTTSKDNDGFNRTYRIDSEAKYDQILKMDRTIKSRIYLRSFDMEQPFIDKKEHSVDITMGEISNKLEVKCYRKPLHISSFALWGEFKFNPQCSLTCAKDGFAPAVSTGFKTINFSEPLKTNCNQVTNEDGRTFTESQLMLEVEGSKWRIDKVKMKVTVEGEPENRCTAIVSEELPLADCDFKNDLDFYKLVEYV